MIKEREKGPKDPPNRHGSNQTPLASDMIMLTSPTVERLPGHGQVGQKTINGTELKMNLGTEAESGSNLTRNFSLSQN